MKGRGMARRGDAADAESSRVVPWTREQIEAWVECRDPESLALGYPTPKIRQCVRWCRSEIVRLCPEAPDYDALAVRLEKEVPATHRTLAWFDAATEEVMRAHAHSLVAALWSRSLSEEPCDDAHEAHNGGAAPLRREGRET